MNWKQPTLTITLAFSRSLSPDAVMQHSCNSVVPDVIVHSCEFHSSGPLSSFCAGSPLSSLMVSGAAQQLEPQLSAAQLLTTLTASSLGFGPPFRRTAFSLTPKLAEQSLLEYLHRQIMQVYTPPISRGLHHLKPGQAKLL